MKNPEQILSTVKSIYGKAYLNLTNLSFDPTVSNDMTLVKFVDRATEMKTDVDFWYNTLESNEETIVFDLRRMIEQYTDILNSDLEFSNLMTQNAINKCRHNRLKHLISIAKSLIA